jgi:hypothetical protein
MPYPTEYTHQQKYPQPLDIHLQITHAKEYQS